MRNFFEKLRFYIPHLLILLVIANDSLLINTWIAPGPIINLKYILLFYFCFYQPDRISVISLFFLGLVFDSLQCTPFGMTSLCFIVVSKLIYFLKKRRTRANFQNEFISFGIVLVTIQILASIIFYYFSKSSLEYSLIIVNTILTLALYPLLRYILQFFCRYQI